MKIVVTAEDIAKGVRECEVSCPIARAIARAFPDAIEVRVDQRYLAVDDIVIAPPAPAVTFITAFDRGEPVEPFEFEIDLNTHEQPN